MTNDDTQDPLDPATPDAAYRPFRPFLEWADITLDLAERRQLMDRLSELRGTATPGQFRAAVTVVRRAAAVETGAIEGLYETDIPFTLSVALRSALWEEQARQRGPGVRSAIEDQIAASELALDLATRRLPISEVALRELHRTVCASQATHTVLVPGIGWQEHPLPRGEYKRQPNHVTLPGGGIHAYAPVLETPVEMSRLVRELQSPAFESAPALLQAAFAHFAFISVHPFADGNGRVARLLASIFLLREHSVPLIVFSDRRPSYYNALRAADQESFQPFVTFLLESDREGLRMAIETLTTARLEPTEQVFERLTRVYEARGPLTDEDVDLAGGALLDALESELRTLVSDRSAPGFIALSVRVRSGGATTQSASHRAESTRGRSGLELTGVTAQPLEQRSSVYVSLEVPIRPHGRETIRLRSKSGSFLVEEPVQNLLGGVPRSLRARLRIQADGLVRRLLADVSSAVVRDADRTGFPMPDSPAAGSDEPPPKAS
jgi:Fic family protein